MMLASSFRTNARLITPSIFRCLSTAKVVNDIPDSTHSHADLMFGTREPWIQEFKSSVSKQHEMMKWEIENNPAICPFNNDAIKQIYRLESNGTVTPSSSENIIQLLGKNAPGLLQGVPHFSLRRKINPYFTLESMRCRFVLVNQLIQKLLQTLYAKTRESENEGVHLYPETKALAFDVVVSAMFGELCTEKEKDTLLQYLTIWFGGWMDVNIEHLNDPNTLLGKAMIAKRDFEELIVMIWRRGIEEYNRDNLEKESTIFGLIDGGAITEDEIGELMLTIVFGGYETTGSSMCNIVYNMYKYNEEKERLKENIKDLDLSSFDDVMNDEYLDSFVKESMRIIPIVSCINKQLQKDCVFNGIQMKKDSFLTVPFVVMNYNENVFDKPDNFDGQRFLRKPPKRSEFIPFSAGIHRCLGEHLAVMEMKCITAALATECDITDVDETRLDPSPSFIKYANIYGKFVPLR